MKFIICLLLLALVACNQDSVEQAQLSACSKELKICPDGQTVGRNPALNCEFDPCPPALAKNQCQDDMKQCPDGSFVTRDDANNCQFKPCPTVADKQPPDVYCPQDVRHCPDGSYVGRDPKQNCAFKLCPDGSQPTETPLKRIK